MPRGDGFIPALHSPSSARNKRHRPTEERLTPPANEAIDRALDTQPFPTSCCCLFPPTLKQWHRLARQDLHTLGRVRSAPARGTLDAVSILILKHAAAPPPKTKKHARPWPRRPRPRRRLRARHTSTTARSPAGRDRGDGPAPTVGLRQANVVPTAAHGWRRHEDDGGSGSSDSHRNRQWQLAYGRADARRQIGSRVLAARVHDDAAPALPRRRGGHRRAPAQPGQHSDARPGRRACPRGCRGQGGRESPVAEMDCGRRRVRFFVVLSLFQRLACEHAD